VDPATTVQLDDWLGKIPKTFGVFVFNVIIHIDGAE
jgi:hypothetical protein